METSVNHNTAEKWVRMLRRFVNQLRMLHFNRQIHTCYPQYFFCWIRYVMEEVRRNLSWKRRPYLFWFGLIPAKRKQTMGILKMPPFRHVRLLTRDEHAHSFCRCVVLTEFLRNCISAQAYLRFQNNTRDWLLTTTWFSKPHLYQLLLHFLVI